MRVMSSRSAKATIVASTKSISGVGILVEDLRYAREISLTDRFNQHWPGLQPNQELAHNVVPQATVKQVANFRQDCNWHYDGIGQSTRHLKGTVVEIVSYVCQGEKEPRINQGRHQIGSSLRQA